METKDCITRSASLVAEAIWNRCKFQRKVAVDKIPKLKAAVFDILLNPSGLTVDPSNGMICIDDVLVHLNELPDIKKLSSTGITALDLALFAIRIRCLVVELWNNRCL